MGTLSVDDLGQRLCRGTHYAHGAVPCGVHAQAARNWLVLTDADRSGRELGILVNAAGFTMRTAEDDLNGSLVGQAADLIEGAGGIVVKDVVVGVHLGDDVAAADLAELALWADDVEAWFGQAGRDVPGWVASLQAPPADEPAAPDNPAPEGVPLLRQVLP